jgi:hypothetical protein
VRKTEIGKSGSEDVVVETAPGCIANLALSNDYLYYLHGAYGLRRTPLVGAAPSSPPLLPESSVGGFVTTSTALFVADKTFTRITRYTLDAQSQMVIHEDLVNTMRTFGADQTSVWWTTEPASGAVGQATLWGLPSGSTTAVKRATGLTTIRTFALDDDWIYVANTLGEIDRLKKDDASPAERVTSIDATSYTVVGLAVIDDWLYVAVGTNGLNGLVDLYRVKKCGGSPRLIAHDTVMASNAIVAAGNAIYFSGGNRLRRFVTTYP